MPRFLIVALAHLIFVSASLAQISLEPGKRRVLRVDVGSEASFNYVASCDGEASVWFRAEKAAVAIELISEDEEVELTAESSRRGEAAHLLCAVKKGTEFSITVLPSDNSPGSDFHEIRGVVIETPIDEAVTTLAARVASGVDALELPEQPLPWKVADALFRSGMSKLDQPHLAIPLLRRALAEHGRILPPGHEVTVRIRYVFAVALEKAGELEEALALFRQVLAAFEQRANPNAASIWAVKGRIATVAFDRADFPMAKRYFEQLVNYLEETRGPGDEHLLIARANLAESLREVGNPKAALELQREILQIRLESLPPEHQGVQSARTALAKTLLAVGKPLEALDLQKAVVTAYVGTLPPNHRFLIAARANLAATFTVLEDAAAAARIQQEALSALEGTVPPDDALMLGIRANLAGSLASLGELETARSMQESILSQRERAFPRDHDYVQTARANLATTLCEIGDIESARKLQELVLEVREAKLASDHLDLQRARSNLAATLYASGKLEAARELQQKVLEVRCKTLSEDHPSVRLAKNNLAATFGALGKFDEAATLQADVLAGMSEALPPDHPSVLTARMNLAASRGKLGRLEEALEEHADILLLSQKTFEDAHPAVRTAHDHVARTLHVLAARDDAGSRHIEDARRTHLKGMIERSKAVLPRLLTSLNERQISRRVGPELSTLDFMHSAMPDGEVPASILELTECARGLGARARRLVRLPAARSETAQRLRETVADARRRLSVFLRSADSEKPTAGTRPGSRMAELVRRVEQAEAALAKSLLEHPEAAQILRPVSSDEIARHLCKGRVAISFSEYTHQEPHFEDGRPVIDATRHTVALLLRSDGTVRRIDLGPTEPIGRAVEDWRDSLESSSAQDLGLRLRKRLLDPVLKLLESPERSLVITLSEGMHAVPLDALPQEDGTSVGDDHSIHVVGCLESLVRDAAAPVHETGFLAVGGIDYGSTPRSGEDSGAADAATRSGGGFRPLPQTVIEIEALAKIYRAARPAGDSHAPPQLLRGREVSVAGIKEAAPRVRFLHLATHGWYSPESIPAVFDVRDFKSLARPFLDDLRQDVASFRPLEFCGLALSGASRRGQKGQPHPGILTGEDLADIDLSRVELAVLSACETNVGFERRGQGVMSLQQALAAAGVHRSLTSLWRVPDEATMKLMRRFYEGVWLEGESMSEALWRAKTALRDQKSADGSPIHGPKDWAGWVLYGNPEPR